MRKIIFLVLGVTALFLLLTNTFFALGQKSEGAGTVVAAVESEEEAIQNRLKEKGLIIPVLDPGKTALKVAEVAADLNLFNSRKAYPSPREKERRL